MLMNEQVESFILITQHQPEQQENEQEWGEEEEEEWQSQQRDTDQQMILPVTVDEGVVLSEGESNV